MGSDEFDEGFASGEKDRNGGNPRSYNDVKGGRTAEWIEGYHNGSTGNSGSRMYNDWVDTTSGGGQRRPDADLP